MSGNQRNNFSQKCRKGGKKYKKPKIHLNDAKIIKLTTKKYEKLFLQKCLKIWEQSLVSHVFFVGKLDKF